MSRCPIRAEVGLLRELVAGRRVTDAETLETVKMVCAGSVSTDLCAALRSHGLKPAGLTGVLFEPVEPYSWF